MLNEANDNAASIVAFTDASKGVGKKASGAVILMPPDQNYLHSIDVLSYGQSKKGIVHSEFRTTVEALHIAPEKSLIEIFSDCSGSVAKLQEYQLNIEAAAFDKMLSVEDVTRLREGLERHPDVKVTYVPRKHESLQIADVFSRMARGQPEGMYSLKIPAIPDLMMQLQELYPQCKTVRSLQKSGKFGEVSDYIEGWIESPDVVPA